MASTTHRALASSASLTRFSCSVVLTAALAALGAPPVSGGSGDGETSPERQAGSVRIDGFLIDRYEYPNIRGHLPLVDVSWEEARDLCRERGSRLCTEAEWEQACRGTADLDYGYGNTFEPGRCNTPWEKDGVWRRGAVAPSGDFADCASELGVHDLIGNVWEWTDGWYDASRRWRPVRGGSWFHNVNLAHADGRYGRHLASTYRLDLIGFRCCRSVVARRDTSRPQGRGSTSD